ncbi:MAG: cell division protein ZapE [Magnetococcales bacterium]|nr:cell division protein ZapE [Magnetococcales bacterium]
MKLTILTTALILLLVAVALVIVLVLFLRARNRNANATSPSTATGAPRQPEPALSPTAGAAPAPMTPAAARETLPLPSRLYHELLEEGQLRPDPDQLAVLPVLDGLVTALRQPAVRGIWRGVEVWRMGDQRPVPGGLYLFGSVGRGKSMLMQLIFDATEVTAKRRVHFQPFMRELQERMHQNRPPPGVDLMLFIASQIAAEARLLCFDEFCVTNIADAMLLGRLLEALFKCGVTLCATSNWPPEDLYQEGMNRGRFMPFIKILTDHTRAVNLSQGADWRRSQGNEGDDTDAALAAPDALFIALTGVAAEPLHVDLQGTEVAANGVHKRIFWFDFNALCDRALGVIEYMELVGQAKALIISGVPVLGPERADATMRLVVLIDLLYESRIPLRIFGTAPLDQLCTSGPVAFAFQRSASRMHELAFLLRQGLAGTRGGEAAASG